MSKGTKWKMTRKMKKRMKMELMNWGICSRISEFEYGFYNLQNAIYIINI